MTSNNNINDTIKNALKYYDEIMENNQKLLSEARFYNVSRKPSDDYAVITLYDHEKKIINKYRCERISIFSPLERIWAWSWSVPKLPKPYTKKSRQMLNYGLDLLYSENTELLKFKLLSSKCILNDDIDIDIQLSLSMYLSKCKYLLRMQLILKNESENTYYSIRSDDKVDDIYIYFLYDL